ncbi:MAG TPA: DinB family protein [Pirellulales bacterium]|nr:DinB family protein [Pirellulales bacterium]
MPTLKQAIERQLVDSHTYTEGLLAGFKTPEEWTHQVHPEANHAMWVAGHIAGADNFFITALGGPGRVVEGYKEKFGGGTKPSPRPADYPPPSEVLDYLRERRQALLKLLAEKSEADLDAPAPAGMPPMIKDVAGIFQLIAWHEGLHAGQASIARRSLGQPPVMQGPPPKPKT